MVSVPGLNVRQVPSRRKNCYHITGFIRCHRSGRPPRVPYRPLRFDVKWAPQHAGSLRPKETPEFFRSKHLRARRPEVPHIPRADDIDSVFGGRLANNSTLEVVVSPDRSNRPRVRNGGYVQKRQSRLDKVRCDVSPGGPPPDAKRIGQHGRRDRALNPSLPCLVEKKEPVLRVGPV